MTEPLPVGEIRFAFPMIKSPDVELANKLAATALHYEARLREAEESRSTIMRDLTARCRELEAERDELRARNIHVLIADLEKAEARVAELEQALRSIAYMGALDGEFYDCRDCGGPERAAAALKTRTL